MSKVTTYHTGMDIRGALAGGDARLRFIGGAITVDGKTLVRVKSIRRFLEGMLAEGKEVLPFGDCDNWDWEKGCPGHVESEAVDE